MKKKTIIGIAALLLTACSDVGEVKTEGNTVPITITASRSNGNTTRVAYEENEGAVTATWETGDVLIAVVDGVKTELPLISGAGATTATFSGAMKYGVTKPAADAQLVAYVKNDNIDINDDGTYNYKEGVMTTQPGTLAGAAALNVYSATAAFGNGTITGMSFTPTTSLAKFTVTMPVDLEAGTDATLKFIYTESSGGLTTTTTLSAPFTTLANPATSDVWFAVPAGDFATSSLQLVAGDMTVDYSLANDVTLLAANSYAAEVEFISYTPLSAVNSSDYVGWAITNDGYVFPSASDIPEGKYAVAMIAYVGEAGSADGSSATYRGLALALKNAVPPNYGFTDPYWGAPQVDGDQCYYCTYADKDNYNKDCLTAVQASTGQNSGILLTQYLLAKSAVTPTNTSHIHYPALAVNTYSVEGFTPSDIGVSNWFLPSMTQWTYMVNAMATKVKGSSDLTSDDKMAAVIGTLFTNVGGHDLKTASNGTTKTNGNYWSSYSAANSTNASYYRGYGGTFITTDKPYLLYVRAALAF